jgi:hypothetical protein
MGNYYTCLMCYVSRMKEGRKKIEMITISTSTGDFVQYFLIVLLNFYFLSNIFTNYDTK